MFTVFRSAIWPRKNKQTNSFKYFCLQKLHICAVSVSHGRIIYLKQSKNEQSVLFYSNFYSNLIKRASSALLPGHLRLTCGVVWCEWGSMWKRPVAPIKSEWILIAGKLSCFQLCCFCNFQVTQLLDQIIFNLRISAKLFTIPSQSSRFVTWWILKLILWLTCWYFFCLREMLRHFPAAGGVRDCPCLRCECSTQLQHLAACKRQKPHKWCWNPPAPRISSHAKQLLFFLGWKSLQLPDGGSSNPTCFHCLAGKQEFRH